MRHLLGAAVIASCVAMATAALTQSAPAPVPVPDTAAPAKPATVPLALGKRMACRAAAQAAQGQDRHDRIQLCMAQARLDCLKQAIDQKVVGPQRREFVQSCTQ
jgi:hypothetical protein